MSSEKIINIELKDNAYDIVIGKGLLARAGDYLQEIISPKSKVFVISDNIVAGLYQERLKSVLEKSGYEVNLISFEGGESGKSFASLESICNQILAGKPERKSTIIALGGGVTGDIAGFCASILLRGVNYIQIPTTLLAMVDSSVGGKTAINTKFGKNLLGTFYQPKLVLTDLEMLETLPEREVLSGYAEIVKYGLINDTEFFEYLLGQKDFSEIDNMIAKSCIAKADVVSKDEKEKGQRALLNLGHTFAHALETLMGYDGRLLHGEAVAIGMVLAFKYSEFAGICAEEASPIIENHFKEKGLRTSIKDLGENFTAEQIIDLMAQDKKVADGKLVFILAKAIGECYIDNQVDIETLKGFLAREV